MIITSEKVHTHTHNHIYTGYYSVSLDGCTHCDLTTMIGTHTETETHPNVGILEEGNTFSI